MTITTNFDPLASRACALFNRFPAIYDLAGIRNESNNAISFEPSLVKGSAIFHLHGQHTGFLLLNTDEKLKSQAERIKPVLQSVMKGRPVIIAGYSGENDPLIDEIITLQPFIHGLYWVCHDDAYPAQNVCKKLLSLPDCHVIRNMPADKFFTDLADALKLDQPVFLANPFEHMLNVLGTIQRPTDNNENANGILLDQADKKLNEAKNNQDVMTLKIIQLVSNEKFKEVWTKYGSDNTLDEDSKELVAWSAIMIGNAQSDQAKTKHGVDADELYKAAYDKYAACIAIKPSMHEAYNNWGSTLLAQAETKHGVEADKLYEAAYKKYAQSLAIRPDKYEDFYNLGNALSSQAKTKHGVEVDELYKAAYDKYAASIAIKPDKYEAFYNLGNALSAQAKIKHGVEADELYKAAYDKYAASIAIKPDKHKAFYNWGAALSDQAKTKHGAEFSNILNEALNKLLEAEKLKAGCAAYNISCFHAWNSDVKQSVHWLKRSKDCNNCPDCDDILQNSDFDTIRDTPEFKQALIDIGCT